MLANKRTEQQSQNIRALSNIVSKLDILQGEVKYFALKSHLNQKLRADDLITDNWPKDENNTHQYFVKMEKELKKEVNRYYNKRYPKIKMKTKVEIPLTEEEKELYKEIEIDAKLNEPEKTLLKNKNKRLKINERLVKAFRVPSRMTTRSDSIKEENSKVEEDIFL